MIWVWECWMRQNVKTKTRTIDYSCRYRPSLWPRIDCHCIANWISHIATQIVFTSKLFIQNEWWNHFILRLIRTASSCAYIQYILLLPLLISRNIKPHFWLYYKWMRLYSNTIDVASNFVGISVDEWSKLRKHSNFSRHSVLSLEITDRNWEIEELGINKGTTENRRDDWSHMPVTVKCISRIFG